MHINLCIFCVCKKKAPLDPPVIYTSSTPLGITANPTSCPISHKLIMNSASFVLFLNLTCTLYLYLSLLQLQQGSHFQCQLLQQHDQHLDNQLGDDILQTKKTNSVFLAKLQNTRPLIYMSLNKNSIYCLMPEVAGYSEVAPYFASDNLFVDQQL